MPSPTSTTLDATVSDEPATTHEFESPDGRIWERDVDHLRGPRSPMMRPIFDEAFSAGLTSTFARLGAPLARAEARHVHGWSYLRMVPAGVPDKPGSGTRTPPAPVLKVLTRLHPELRRRERTARRAIEEEVWMRDIDAWWAERPGRVQALERRQAVDLSALDDAALAGEVERAADEGARLLLRHFELVTAGAGVGMAVIAAAEHGIPGADVAEALRGASSSTAAPAKALHAISVALRRARADEPTDLASLRSASDEVRALVDRYLATYGWRCLGDDLTEPTLAESPDLLLRSVLAASEHPEPAQTDPVLALVERVAPSDRGRIERLLRQAASAYEMLDDNSAFASWGLGVFRRVLLETGRRLASAARLTHAEQVFLLDVDEAAALLRGATTPDTVEIEARERGFEAARASEAPTVLGGPPGPRPDASVFPRGVATITAAVTSYLGLRFQPPDERAGSGRIEIDGRVVATGHGIGASSATGRAVVAWSPDDAIERLEPGDVLVCPFTNPAYNIVFPIAAAVVTQVGGPLGHAAVTAREVGIPAVVGIGDLDVIPDGAMVTVVGA